jgi:sporulation protein YlmC with PRC-barrel domain
MMDIATDVCIVCLDGPFGYLDGIILDPITDEVTHLVVQEDKLLGIKRMVPVEEIVESNFRYILLQCTLQELSEFELFTDVEFIPVNDQFDYAYDLPDLEDRTLFSWPYATTKPGFIPLEHEHVPSNELMIGKNTEVFATDGRVGFIDDLMIKSDTHQITDLAVRVGYFWGYKDVDIPMDEIEKINPDSVFLKLNKDAVESLPAISEHGVLK